MTTKIEKNDKLTLYHFDACPYCARVRTVIDELGLDVEQRDIREDPSQRDELVARGLQTVPVLRITAADGEEQWMPESQDIVDYLRREFGA